MISGLGEGQKVLGRFSEPPCWAFCEAGSSVCKRKNSGEEHYGFR